MIRTRLIAVLGTAVGLVLAIGSPGVAHAEADPASPTSAVTSQDEAATCTYVPYVSHVQAAGIANIFPNDPGWQTAGRYPGVVALSHSVSVSNTWNATVGVAVGVVSAAVGYSVTSSWTTTTNYSLSTVDTGLGAGLYHVYGYQRMAWTTFEVWRYSANCHVRQRLGFGNAYRMQEIRYGWYKG